MQEADELLNATAKGDLDIREMLLEIINAFGGIKKFTAEVAASYWSAPEGSANRVRILSDTLRLVSANPAEGDESAVSTEDLEAEAAALSAKLSGA